MSLRNRIAAAFAAALLASPALAADVPQDCTVCRDPTWPSLENLAPGIPLNQAPAVDTTATPGEVSFAARLSRSPGVGVVASSTGSTAYSDPTWPTLTRGPAGMAMPSSTPAQPARSAPATTGAVASR
jgi:opacity protein-like surface antigen